MPIIRKWNAMNTLGAMHQFVRAVELGSLSAAARELGTTQPTVSKTVAALERHLGTRLLNRTTTHLVPTEAGKRFYERARRVLDEYNEAVAEVRGQTERPEGHLRVNVPVSLGVLRLNALMVEFMRRYPAIDVELSFNDRFVDLTEESIDVALRLGGDLPLDAVARRVATSPRYLVVAPELLETAADIQRPEDILALPYLRFAWLAAGETLELTHENGATARITPQSRYTANSSLAIRESLLLGAGVGFAPAWLVGDLIESGALVRMLPQWRGQIHEAFLIYPQRRYQPLRARLLLEFLEQRVPLLPGFERV
jgi:DNA-binding transcriptional LysR family regulator